MRVGDKIRDSDGREFILTRIFGVVDRDSTFHKYYSDSEYPYATKDEDCKHKITDVSWVYCPWCGLKL